MPKINFAPEDFTAKMQIPSGWYEGHLKSVKEKPGKTNPDTITYHLEFIVDEGPCKGVTAMMYCNNAVSSQMGDLLNLFRCFVPGGKVAQGQDYEVADCIDRPVSLNMFYNVDMTMNQVKDFKPSNRKAA